MAKTLLRLQQQQVAEYVWQRAVDCEFLNKMTYASHIRTLFSLVVKNISGKWKCCITTNANEGESVDGNKIHSFPLFCRIWCSHKEDP